MERPDHTPAPRRGRMQSTLTGARRGAAAGLGATAAMTVVMAALRPATRGNLAPRQVTAWMLGQPDPASAGARAPVGLSMVNHAGYGSALGALYGAMVGPDRAGPFSGLVYGLMVWASNYAGLLPALGVLPPPPDDDTSHAVRVHASHWVYGAVLGVLARGRPDITHPRTRRQDQ